MRRFLTILILIALTGTLAACSSPTSELEGTPAPTIQQPTQELTRTVEFADPTLERMIRAAMGKPDGDITVAEAEAVTALNLSFEWRRLLPDAVPVRKIDGLVYFKNLESLDLSFHEITDIAPLARLNKLITLSLRGNPVNDITPLSGLTNLNVLALDHCSVNDFAPLAALTGIRHLYLAECPSSDYAPLDGIYPNLEGRDFEILPPPTTLAELGFTFNDGDKLALYGTDEYDIRLNHGEWGDPPQPDWQNCIRVVSGADSGYKNTVGFYPVHNAYVVWMFDPNTQENYTYVYDVAENSFGCERADMEPIVREAFGDADGEDVLLTPVVFFDNTIREALGIAIDTLYSMPFDENIVLASPYVHLGFEFLDYKGTYYYEGYGIELHIHKPEWDKDVEDGHKLDWSMSFFEPNVKGYQTQIYYLADKNVYYISMEKDGAEVTFSYYPAEDKYEYDPNDIDPLRPTLTEALGDDFMRVPMEIFAANVQERFGMSIDELYALSIE
jgi:hypothetical protein